MDEKVLRILNCIRHRLYQSESALNAKLTSSPLFNSDGPVVVHGGHAEGEEGPAEDGEDWVNPINNWVDSDTTIEFTKGICEHIEQAHRNNHSPILDHKLHISEHSVESCLEEGNTMKRNHMKSHVKVMPSPAKVGEDVGGETNPEDDHDQQV